MTKLVTVYPCQCPEGHHLDRPPVPTEVTPDEANWLVATKAFSYDPDGLHELEAIDERAVYDPDKPSLAPPPAEPPTEAPAGAGALDS